jgi:hypothetical protein
MKLTKVFTVTGLIAAGASLAFMLSGCLNPSPPTAAEAYLYNIQTNYVPIYVPAKTNTVTQTNTVQITLTNQLNGVVITNLEPQVVRFEVVVPATTNYQAQYSYSPGTGSQAIAGTVGGVGSMFGLPFLGSAVTALFSLWGWIRSSRNGQAMGSSLAQIIETGREILKTLPNGAQYDAAYLNFMQQHQTDTGTILGVAELLKKAVSNATAKQAAQDIIDVVQGISPPSAPPGK